MRLLLLSTLIFLSACSKDLTFFSQTEKSEIKLCFIGDTGIGNDLQRKVARKLETERCDSIHFIGDLVYPDGITDIEDLNLKTKFLDVYLPLTTKGNKPKLHLILGNHDYKGSVSPWYEVAQKERGIFFPHTFYLLKNRSLCMVHLDTNVFRLVYEWGEALEEIFWLSSLRDDLEDCKIKIALTHHPFKSRGKKHGSSTGMIKLFQESYVVGHFDYLISGHDHILSDEGMVDGTRMLITGAGGDPDEGEDAGYLVMTANLKSGNVAYEFKYIK